MTPKTQKNCLQKLLIIPLDQDLQVFGSVELRQFYSLKLSHLWNSTLLWGQSKIMLPDVPNWLFYFACNDWEICVEKLKLRIYQKLIFYRKSILGLVSMMQLCKNLLYIFAILPLSRYENWCQMSVRLFVVFPDTIKNYTMWMYACRM